jgi:membrane-bound lytic murein transglycosylase A
MRVWGRIATAALLALAVSACTLIPQTRPPKGYPAPVPSATSTPAPVTSPVPAPPPPPNSLLLGVHAGPSIESLPLSSGRASAALRSFVESCPKLTSRTDTSGLTRSVDWVDACTAAPTWLPAEAPAFFARYFEAARVSDGKTFVTGYYDPEIAGVRLRQPGFGVPVYAVPPDLVRGWPDSVPVDQRTGTPPLGRIDETGKFVPYYDRAAIDAGALANKGLEIAWAADYIELFFLQIQGSGRLIAPDGTIMRIGYAGQNGREYAGIGSIMRQRGLIGQGTAYPTSMQGLMAYLREHPEDGPNGGSAIMRENPSYVFFREITGDGPYGALNVPVRGQSSVAIDPQFVPLGAPVWLSVDRPETTGLWIAQDTGGAIKGANRFDSFWGAGPTARTIAGGMSARGDALLFLPKGTLARLGVQ